MTRGLTCKLHLKQHFYSHNMTKGIESLEDYLFVLKEIVVGLETTRSQVR